MLLKWMNGWERVLFIAIVLLAFAGNVFNMVINGRKLVEARDRPVTTASFRSRTKAPDGTFLTTCSLNPLDPMVAGICEKDLYMPTGESAPDGTPLVAFVPTPVPCNEVAYTYFGFSCIDYPLADVYPSATNPTFSFSIRGSTQLCFNDKARCGTTAVYAMIRSADQELASSTTQAAFKPLPLPTHGTAFLHIGMSTIQRLHKNAITSFPLSATVIRSFEQEPSPTLRSYTNASFGITIDQFSWDLDEIVRTETIVFDTFDALASLAAIASVSVGIIYYFYPSSLKTPVHFRFGSRRAYEKAIHSVAAAEAGALVVGGAPHSHRRSSVIPVHVSDSDEADSNDNSKIIVTRIADQRSSSSSTNDAATAMSSIRPNSGVRRGSSIV